MNKDSVKLLGLCANAESFGISTYELKMQFYRANLNSAYPFGEDEYDKSCMERKMHLDPKRVAWVQDRIYSPAKGQSEDLTRFYKMWMFIRNDIIESESNNKVIRTVRNWVSNFFGKFKASK